MKSSLLKDSALEAQMQQEGVVRIPFLTPEELNEVQTFYKDLHGGQNPPALYDGIHMTIWSPDLNYKLTIKEKLFENGFCKTVTPILVKDKPKSLSSPYPPS